MNIQKRAARMLRKIMKRDPLFNQDMERLNGVLGEAIGKSAESSVLNALKSVNPGWYISGRPATEYEDRHGVDLFLRVLWRGKEVEIPIQVKSSQRRAERHKARNFREKQFIYVVVIKTNDSDTLIVKKIYKAVRISIQKSSERK